MSRPHLPFTGAGSGQFVMALGSNQAAVGAKHRSHLFTISAEPRGKLRAHKPTFGLELGPAEPCSECAEKRFPCSVQLACVQRGQRWDGWARARPGPELQSWSVWWQ